LTPQGVTVSKDLLTAIRESGAQPGDLIYVRSSTGTAVAGARLSTSRDLLQLKVEALSSSEPLVAVGPEADETFADVVIDANGSEPSIVKSKAQNGEEHVPSEG
jgi:thiamine monophosphate kinase